MTTRHLIWLYLSGGFVFGLVLDRDFMKEDPPYKDAPGIFSLHTIRIMAVSTCVVFGLPILIVATFNYWRARLENRAKRLP